MLKKLVTRWDFSHSNFFNGFMLLFTSSNKDLSNDTLFLKKNLLLLTV